MGSVSKYETVVDLLLAAGFVHDTKKRLHDLIAFAFGHPTRQKISHWYHMLVRVCTESLVYLALFICHSSLMTLRHLLHHCPQARFEYIKSQLLPFLKSCGFKEAALQWLPAVGPQGLNLTQPPAEPLLSSWWSGPTVVQAIDTFKAKPRLTSKLCACI
jgi:hypothetical protein